MPTLLSSLASYIRRLLRLRPMADITLHTLLGYAQDRTPQYDVTAFVEWYLLACTTSGTTHGPSHRAQRLALLRSAYVRSIKLMKARNVPEHEYILAHVYTVDPSGRHYPLAILKCERTVAANTTALRHAKAAVAGSQALASPSYPSSVATSDSIPAIDQFIVYHPSTSTKTIEGKDREAYSTTFPRTENPPFEHLIAAASALHALDDKYRLFTHQCFWWAGMIYRILVGPEAGNAKPVDKAAVVQIVRDYENAQARAAAEEGPAGTKAVKVTRVEAENKTAAGVFSHVFHIVTRQQIEESYNSVEPKLTETIAELGGQVSPNEESVAAAVAEVAPTMTLEKKLALLAQLDIPRDQIMALLSRQDEESAAAGPSAPRGD